MVISRVLVTLRQNPAYRPSAHFLSISSVGNKLPLRQQGLIASIGCVLIHLPTTCGRKVKCMSDIETPGAQSCAFPAVSSPQGALDRIRRFGPSFTLAFFRNSQDSVSLLSVDGVIEYMNPNGLAILGFDRSDEIAGLAWDTLWLPEARTKVLAALKQAQNGVPARYEATLGHLNAPEVHCTITLSPLMAPDGHVDALLAVVRSQ